MFDKLCEVQSDKATVEITSRYDGVVKKLYHKVGEMAKVGQPLCDIETTATATSSPAPAPSTPSPSPAPSTPPTSAAKPSPTTPPPPLSGPVPAAPPAPSLVQATSGDINEITFATPAVRRIAKESGVDLKKVTPTGKDGGALSHIDVTPRATTAAPSSSPSSRAPTPVPSTTVPLTPLQKSMFKNMTRALQIPHFLYTDQILTDSISALRASINAHITANPAVHPMSKISYMPILVKALSCALLEFPLLNAQLVTSPDDPTDVTKARLVHRASHNVGFAMDSPIGLVVPVLKDVQSKTVLDIAADMHRLTQLGKTGQIPPGDFAGATTTLSNIGNVGGGVVGPVVPPDTLAIVGVGAIRRVPVVEGTGAEERVVIRGAMTVSVSADHRVVDGATVARFVARWKEMVEDVGVLVAGLR
ncbi:hypothetical protein HDU93_001682 [Gonapodya sp. JEL0774]|nr:hypothetical protein HDU93_001682 [Gonapodya sp. JEL0774]